MTRLQAPFSIAVSFGKVQGTIESAGPGGVTCSDGAKFSRRKSEGEPIYDERGNTTPSLRLPCTRRPWFVLCKCAPWCRDCRLVITVSYRFHHANRPHLLKWDAQLQRLKPLFGAQDYCPLMDKADLAQVASKDESDLEAAPQNDATGATTRPTLLGRTHGCVSGIWGFLVALMIV